ncbi:two-component system, chemotaxis family, response regulator CheY [Tindallia californiensis]|uniref:Stage 0 sporulation protein A homolog n=2 Tax=Tindallia californiensis TaxID=159292 RepID=A0A1H3KFX9_9FIRM|nr:two-component system, chemotaxis family, response regulator CheY [Tindallia californiensis]
MMKKILICDDSLLIRRQLKQFFHYNWKEFEIVEAINGKEAVELYRAEKPFLVFMDIVMPEMDGVSSLKEICQTDSDAKIIVLSSVGNRETLREAIDAGAIDFVQKPWTDEVMNKIIKTYCS